MHTNNLAKQTMENCLGNSVRDQEETLVRAVFHVQLSIDFSITCLNMIA